MCVRNITKRANNCVHFKIIHIQMVGGCLVLKFAKSKGYKIIEEHVIPWHVYANNFEPEICQVLEMTRYIFQYHRLLNKNCII